MKPGISARVAGRVTKLHADVGQDIEPGAVVVELESPQLDAAKLAMEQALTHAPEVTALRIGNYAGSGALFHAARQGPVSLDQFPDGRSPLRSYIGPVSLARVLAALLAAPGALPPVLNVALPGGVEMAALLHAAALPFTLRPAPETACAEMVLDVTQLCALRNQPPATASALILEARAGGLL